MSVLTTPQIPKGYGMYSLPTMGGGQKDIYEMIKGKFGQGGGNVYDRLLQMAGGQGDIFQQMEIPARRGLESELANIGMQFGLSGSQKSSGFQNAIAGAGQRFAEDIYGQRAGLMQQSMRDVLGLGNMLLGTPTEQFGLYQKENLLRDIMQLIGGVGSQALGIWGGSKLAGIGGK
jgi:hypothetical protein